MTPAYLIVKIDGDDIHALSRDAILLEADIEFGMNEHASCRLHYRQTPDQRFPVEDMLGKTLEVHAVDSSGAQLPLFVGEVAELDLDYEISGAYEARIKGYSHSIRMDVTPNLRSHEPAALTGHLARLLEYSSLELTPDYAETGATQASGGLLQIGETDFQFFHRFVDQHGLVFRARTDGIQVLDQFVDAGTAVEWREEGGLLDFKLHGKLAAQDYSGWVYNRKESSSSNKVCQIMPADFGTAVPLISAASSQSAANHWHGCLPTPFLCFSDAGLDHHLGLESLRAAQSRVYATGVSREASIRPVQKLTINGPIDAAGTWGVLKVIHRWRPEGYTNEFIATPFSRPLGWVRPENTRWPGLMVARVVAVGRDGQEGYVEIQFPWETGEPWLWARFMSPYAGQNRGIYYSPEAGDEVMVAFEFGDTNRPVITGSMWNGVETAPAGPVYGEEYKTNDVKRIATKSGNRLVMDDKEGKETVVLATPHHVRVSLFDGGSKLLLHCDGDIHIHAGGTVHMKCAKFLREIG